MTTVASAQTNQLIADRYHLLESVGSGGMATVYRARDQRVGRDVAVKVFNADAAPVADRIRQDREISLLSVLTHPSLISLYDAGEHAFGASRRRFLVMELIVDPTLRERMDVGPLPAHEVAAIGAQAADALAYVHSQGIAHRDVKPANILISDAASSGFLQTVKLTDFGIARYIDGRQLTMDGTIIGTAAYLSPEQVAGEPVSEATDVYSLGLVLLEALTGSPEYTGTLLEAAIARLNRDPVIPDRLAAEWRTLLAAMTARDPAQRPTAAIVAATLRGRGDSGADHARSEHGTGRHRARPNARGELVRERSRRRRQIAMITTTAVVFVLACATSWVLGAAFGP
jgi:eukaryotic-like serine/threonine-protein kinase